MGTILFIGLSFALYLLPAIIGRNKRNAQAIFVLNLFLGWTVLGWIVALVWAVTVDPPNLATKRTQLNCGACGHPIRQPERYCSHCSAEIDWS